MLYIQKLWSSSSTLFRVKSKWPIVLPTNGCLAHVVPIWPRCARINPDVLSNTRCVCETPIWYLLILLKRICVLPPQQITPNFCQTPKKITLFIILDTSANCWTNYASVMIPRIHDVVLISQTTINWPRSPSLGVHSLCLVCRRYFMSPSQHGIQKLWIDCWNCIAGS